MIRLMRFTLRLGLLAGLGLLATLGGVNVPIAAQTAAPRSSQPLPPPPPSTPPPNSTRSGGSLSASSTCGNPTQTGSQSSSQSSSQSLIALVPIDNPVLTTSAHPTFLFYVPYSSKQVKFGEFSMLVGPAETTRFYRTRFALPETPGIVSIILPSDSEPIAKDVFYHWYFKLYCQENTSRANVEVNGWVKRVEPIAAQSHETAMPVIWYDAIADLGDRLRVSPQDTALKNRWRALLTLIHAEDLADKPLVGSVRPTGAARGQ